MDAVAVEEVVGVEEMEEGAANDVDDGWEND